MFVSCALVAAPPSMRTSEAGAASASMRRQSSAMARTTATAVRAASVALLATAVSSSCIALHTRNVLTCHLQWEFPPTWHNVLFKSIQSN
jgi:hypothetical protein